MHCLLMKNEYTPHPQLNHQPTLWYFCSFFILHLDDAVNFVWLHHIYRKSLHSPYRMARLCEYSFRFMNKSYFLQMCMFVSVCVVFRVLGNLISSSTIFGDQTFISMRIPVSIHTVAYARKYYLQCYMKWNANNDSDLNDCVEYCTISTASIRSNSQSYGSLHLLHYPKSNTHTKNIRRAQNFRWIALCDATQPIATSQTNTTFNIPTTNKNNNSTRLAISILKVNLNTAWHTMHNNCCLNSIDANIVSKGEWEHLFIVIWQTNGIYGLLLHCVINPTIFTGLLPDFIFSNAMDLSVLNRFQLLFVTRKNTYNFRIITIESDKHTGWVTQKKNHKAYKFRVCRMVLLRLLFKCILHSFLCPDFLVFSPEKKRDYSSAFASLVTIHIIEIDSMFGSMLCMSHARFNVNDSGLLQKM